MKTYELPSQVLQIMTEFRTEEMQGQVILNYNEGRIESMKVIRHQRIQLDNAKPTAENRNMR